MDLPRDFVDVGRFGDPFLKAFWALRLGISIWFGLASWLLFVPVCESILGWFGFQKTGFRKKQLLTEIVFYKFGANLCRFLEAVCLAFAAGNGLNKLWFSVV